MANKYRFGIADRAMLNAVTDLTILSGDIVGPSNRSVDGVLTTAIANLEVLLKQLKAAQEGQVADPPLVFPSVKDAVETAMN